MIIIIDDDRDGDRYRDGQMIPKTINIIDAIKATGSLEVLGYLCLIGNNVAICYFCLIGNDDTAIGYCAIKSIRCSCFIGDKKVTKLH